MGTCTNCGACGLNQFRRGCDGVSAGSCASCLNDLQTCPKGYYRTGCSGLSIGNCESRCTNAASDEYYVSNGGLLNNCQVATCPTCPDGQYRANCAGQIVNSDGSAPGECRACETLDVGKYFNPSCAGVSSGDAKDCPGCPNLYMRVGCEANSEGTCESRNCDEGPNIVQMTTESKGNCAGTNHGGTCTLDCNLGYEPSVNTLTCLYGRWTEATCSNKNDCFPNPCMNGGTCTDEINGFQCQCTHDYSGPTCTWCSSVGVFEFSSQSSVGVFEFSS